MHRPLCELPPGKADTGHENQVLQQVSSASGLTTRYVVAQGRAPALLYVIRAHKLDSSSRINYVWRPAPLCGAPAATAIHTAPRHDPWRALVLADAPAPSSSLSLPWRKNNRIPRPAIHPPTPITAEAPAGMSQAAEWAVTILPHHFYVGD